MNIIEQSAAHRRELIELSMEIIRQIDGRPLIGGTERGEAGADEAMAAEELRTHLPTISASLQTTAASTREDAIDDMSMDELAELLDEVVSWRRDSPKSVQDILSGETVRFFPEPMEQ